MKRLRKARGRKCRTKAYISRGRVLALRTGRFAAWSRGARGEMMTTATRTLDTQALRQFLERVRSDTEEFIHLPRGVRSVYHYTDLAGMCGIVQSHDLWLTHSRFGG